MKNVLIWCFVCLSFFSSLAQENKFQDFDIFVGKWERDIKKGMTHEFWEKIDNSTYKGKSLNITSRDSTILETVFIKIFDNEIYYIVSVPGQNKEKPVEFKLVNKDNDTFVFENLKHDFPQIIIYKFVSKENLKAQIKGKINDKWKIIDFNYHKLK